MGRDERFCISFCTQCRALGQRSKQSVSQGL